MKYFFALQYVKLFYAFFVYFLCINSVFSFDFSKNEKRLFCKNDASKLSNSQLVHKIEALNKDARKGNLASK